MPRPRGVHSLATHARVVRVERKQHAAAQEPCCGRTLALRNDIWVPSIGACRSALCNTTVRDILEPPGACTNHHVATPLPTVRGDTACGPGPTCGEIGNARGTLHACYWNSLLGALTQALIPRCDPCGHVTVEVGQRERSLTSCNPPRAEIALTPTHSWVGRPA